MLSPNKTLVDENNLEIKPNSVIHCLGSLFQVMDTGLRHIVGKKIDDDTYFADPDLYIQLNKLAFVSDVAITPDAAPRKEGLLASAYRFMTAPFLVRTPRMLRLVTSERILALTNWYVLIIQLHRISHLKLRMP